MNYRPEVSTDGGKTFGQNGQIFPTKEEAEHMARDIYGRWMLATDYRATETEDPVNYTIVDGVLMPVEKELVAETEGGDHD